MAKKYGLFDQSGNISGDINIAKRIVEENGGLGIVESALKKANSPIVKTFLSKIGINTEAINNAVNELKGTKNDIVESTPNNSVTDISNRLNKLK